MRSESLPGSPMPLKPPQWFSQWLLRALMAGLLLVVLVDPHWHWGKNAVHWVVLVDESSSMPRDFIDELWPKLSHEIENSPVGSSVEILRYGADVVTEFSFVDTSVVKGDLESTVPDAMPRLMPVNRTATDLEQALRTALGKFRGTAEKRLVLVTDGRNNQGKAKELLETLASRDIETLWLSPPEVTSSTEPEIAHFQVPAEANARESVPVSGLIRFPDAITAAKSDVTIKLFLDGKELSASSISGTGYPLVPFSEYLPPLSPGVHKVDLRLEAAADRADTHRTALVNVAGGQNLVLVSHDSKVLLPALRKAADLSANIISVTPGEFHRALNAGLKPDLILLDDIAIGDISPSGWRELIQTVREQGSALLVLGGQNSFSSGGYRGSDLETILPVIAKPQVPQQPLRLMFVVDKSGSMDTTEGAASRLSLALGAVNLTAGQLQSEDLAGLILFDAETRQQVPLANPASLIRWLEQASLKANGGTLLKPAIRAAVSALDVGGSVQPTGQAVGIPVGGALSAQKLLVLVTDGQSEEERLSELIDPLISADIELLILAIGNPEGMATLRNLAEKVAGRVFEVGQIAQLPQLMQQQVLAPRLDYRSNGYQAQALMQVAMNDLPAVNTVHWKTYQLVSAKSDADVYWQSDRGDPLWIVGRAGLGQVTVISGGLGEWLGGRSKKQFTQALLKGQSGRQAESDLRLTSLVKPGAIAVTVDWIKDGNWVQSPELKLGAISPLGVGEEYKLEEQVPGSFSANVTAPIPGPYELTLVAGDHRIHRTVNYSPLAENGLATQVDTALLSLVARQQISQWNGQPFGGLWRSGGVPHSMRPLILMLALALWLGIIFKEFSVLSRLRKFCGNAFQSANNQIKSEAADKRDSVVRRKQAG